VAPPRSVRLAGSDPYRANFRPNTPYADDSDYIFASPKMKGKQPYWMSRIMQHHIKPTAAEAGTSSETKAPSRHKSSLSGSFPQDSRVGLTLSTRGTAISNEDGLSGDVLLPP
jgi:hypothetical protein